MNICDEELPQLAGADASCVGPWICSSPWSVGQQCYTAQQHCKESWLSSHQNITLLPCKLLPANTWAPQCSGDKGRRKTSAVANGSFKLLPSRLWAKLWIFLCVVRHMAFKFSLYVTPNEDMRSCKGLLLRQSADKWRFLYILTSTQM